MAITCSFLHSSSCRSWGFCVLREPTCVRRSPRKTSCYLHEPAFGVILSAFFIQISVHFHAELQCIVDQSVDRSRKDLYERVIEQQAASRLLLTYSNGRSSFRRGQGTWGVKESKSFRWQGWWSSRCSKRGESVRPLGNGCCRYIEPIVGREGS